MNNYERNEKKMNNTKKTSIKLEITRWDKLQKHLDKNYLKFVDWIRMKIDELPENK